MAGPLEPAYREVALFLGAAAVIVPLLQRLKVSPVLGFLLAGVVLGPSGLGSLARLHPWLQLLTITRAEEIRPLAEFGVVLLLFMIGLELSWQRLRSLRRWVFGLGTAQALACTGVLAILGLALGQGPISALLLGAALALSSTAVVLPVLAERGKLQAPGGRACFAVLLFQDLAAAPLLAAVPLLANPGRGGLAGEILSALVPAVLGLAIIVVAGRLLLRPLMLLVARSKRREFFMAACLLVIVATGMAATAAGLSMAVGAFIAGLLLAETEYRRQVEAAIGPFRGLFLGLFFVTVGVQLDLSAVARAPIAVLGLAVAIVAIKAPVTALLARLTGATGAAAVRAGLLLAPAGEFAFVLIGAAATLGLIPQDAASLALVAATLSLFAIPPLAELADRIARRLARGEGPAGPPPAREDEPPRVLIVGFGRVGRLVAEMLERHGQPYLAVDADPRLVAQARRGGAAVYYGDASEPELLGACGLERARALVVTLDAPETAESIVAAARALRPDLTIVARARDAAHATRLYALGATDAVPETVEASLQLAENTLIDIGRPMGLVIASIHERREEFRNLFRKSIGQGREPRAFRRALTRASAD